MKVAIAAAISADGFINPAPSMRTFEWTSKEDRRFVVQLSKDFGTIIMGAKTFATFKIKRAPPGRRLLIYTNHPEDITGENVETTNQQPDLLLKRLEREGAHAVLLEGGTSIYQLFMDAGLVDEVYLTVEPVLFGDGVPFFVHEMHAQLTLLDTAKLNDNVILLHYAVSRRDT